MDAIEQLISQTLAVQDSPTNVVGAIDRQQSLLHKDFVLKRENTRGIFLRELANECFQTCAARSVK